MHPFSLGLAMHSYSRLFAAAAIAAAALPAAAATSTYTTAGSFAAAVQAGAYTETFSVANPTFPAPDAITYSGSGFSFSVFTPPLAGGVYTSGAVLGTNAPGVTLSITFGPGVTAVGGNFYISDITDNFLPAGSVTLTLNDGTTTTYTPTSISDFRGFTSDVAITSLTFAAPVANYSNIDNLTVGRAVVTAVPEGSTWAMMALGMAGLLLAARKREA